MDLKEEFRSLKILHSSLMIGTLLVSFLMYYLADSSANELSFDFSLTEGMVLVFAMAISSIPQLNYNKRLDKIRAMNRPEEKWEAYRQVQILRYASLEGTALMCVVFYFLKGNLFFFIVALIFALALYSYRPNELKLEYETGLKIEE